MPWCEDCAKFWTPSSMRADGTCPKCGRTLPMPNAGRDRATTPGEAGQEQQGSDETSEKLDLKKLAGKDAKAPWHFKLLMVLLAIYLTWRLVQLIGIIF
jgi:hypothetical protein